MKKVFLLVAALALLCLGVAAQAALVNLSLEPSTSTVSVGDPFSLELWMRSSPTGQSLDGADVNLQWNPLYVRFDGFVENGDYDWMTVFYTNESKPGFDPTFSDGTAEFTLFAQLPRPSPPTPYTDLHALTLNFTALAATDSTSLTIPSSLPGNLPTCVAWQGDDITGTLTGADIEIVPVPEPSSIIALAGGLIPLLAMKRRKA